MQSAADHLVLAAMRRGNPRAIVLAEDEYEAFIATLELEEDKDAQDDIRAGLEETRHGLPPTWAEFKAELQGHGSGETDTAF
jgi:PHD/YefM family antitoxin component YafN of YafNO toxin-antitoxin module